MNVRNRLLRIGMSATLAAMAVIASAAPANAAYRSHEATLVMQLKTPSGQLLAKEVNAGTAKTTNDAGILTVTCYVDDRARPFRISTNVAFRTIIGCDAPVISAKYLEVLFMVHSPDPSTEHWRKEGVLPGPLTTWTPFDPVVAPCVNALWAAAFGVTVQFTPDFSLSASFQVPDAYITDCP